jgi:hypothetical protein
MMKTGQGEIDMTSFLDESMQLVLEMLSKSTVLAGYYIKACGRSTLTSVDLEYCMKYISMSFKSSPEFMDQFDFDEDEDEDEELDIETVDEDDEPFTRYVGKDTVWNNVNKAYDTWDSWTPPTLLQQKFKDAVDDISTKG